MSGLFLATHASSTSAATPLHLCLPDNFDSELNVRLRHARLGAGGWIYDTVQNDGAGPSCLIHFDAMDRPHIATVKDAAAWHHVRSGSGWTSSEWPNLDGRPYAPYPQIMAVESDGTTHLALRYEEPGFTTSIGYGTDSTGQGSVESFMPTQSPILGPLALGVDANHTAHVAFMSWDSSRSCPEPSRVFIASREASGWNEQRVPCIAPTTEVVFDDLGHAHGAYTPRSGTPGLESIVYFTNASGQWEFQVVEAAAEFGVDSLAWADGHVHIFYGRSGDYGSLYHAVPHP